MPLKLNIPLPSKGLVVDRPGEYVDSRSAAAIKNMEFNRSIIRKRIGSSILGATLSERVMRYFELQVGNQTRLFRVGLTKFQDLNKSTSVWSSATSTLLTGSSNNPISYGFPLLSGAKIVVYTNLTDSIRKCLITGNDATLGGSPPKCKFLISYGPYLVLAYVIDAGDTFYSRVQWCDTGDPETWSGGNAGSTDLLEDSEDITGLGIFGGVLTVHKLNSIYTGQLVSTSDVFSFERRATGVGAVTEATIQNIPSGEQIFLATDGIHLFNGITAPLIESPIQDEIRESINPQYFDRCQSVFVEEADEYWVSVPIGSSSEAETVYKYNWRTKQIYKDERDNLTAMGTYLNTADLTWDDAVGSWDSNVDSWDSNRLLSASPIVILGDSNGISTIRSSATNDDNSTAVESILETKDFTCEDFGITDIDSLMRWKGMQVWAKGTGVSVYYSLDGGTTWGLISTLSLNSDYPDDDSPLNVWFDYVKSRIRFRFVNSSSEGTFTLKKYQVSATPREARR